MQESKVYLYPVWVRLWHLANAILCLILIFTGISMQYASPETPLIPFNISVSLHNLSGVLLTCFYLVFLIGNISTWNGKYYRIKLKGFIHELMKQARYYAYGIFVGENAPYKISKERKFNPIQKLTYVSIMYICLPLIFITGWALLFPETIATRFLQYGGITLTSLFHAVLGFFVSLFLIIHIYFCTIGHTPTANFKSMVNGYHEPHN